MDHIKSRKLDEEIRARREATQYKKIDLELLLANCISLIEKSRAILTKSDGAKH